MDLDRFRSFILDSGVDVWNWIDMAISVAAADHENELKERRDGIVQKLYARAFSRCQNCHRQLSGGTDYHTTESERYQKRQDVGFDCNTEGYQSMEKLTQEEEEDGGGGDDNDDEQRRILEIKILLDDQNQSERSLIDLLQMLVDMDTTFSALKETDIGRHVTRLRKHSSSEVRRLVKVLVRKWKDTVDKWVRLNAPLEEATTCNDDGKAVKEAHQESTQNGETAEVIRQADAHINSVSCYSTPAVSGKVRHDQVEGSAEKRLHGQSHDQETQHAKKQRTAQLVDFHNFTKTKNSVVSSNGGNVPVKYW